MDKAKLEKFKKLLKEEREKLVEELVDENEDFMKLEQSETGDLADQAYKQQEKEMLINLSQKEQAILKLIDNALERIENNKYGKCLICGCDIDENRLEAIPYVETCIKCKNKKK